MNENYKYLTNNIILFSISTFGSKIITFLLIPLYTNYLSTSDYGGIDLVSTLLSVTLPILTFCLESSLLRYCMDESYKKDEVLGTAFHIWLRALLFNFIVTSLLYIFGIFSSIENFYLYYILFFFSSGTSEILSSIYRGTDYISVMVETSLIRSITLCIFSILLIVLLSMGIWGYVLSYTISELICIIWGFLRAHIHFYWDRFDKNIERELLRYGGPLIFNQIGWWINNSLDKYVVLIFLGLSQNGIYSIAYKIPTILSVLSGIFANAWSLSAIKSYNSKGADEFATKMYNLYNSFLVIICSILLLFNIPIARILFAKEFFNAWRITGILIIATAFNGLSGFIGSFFSAAKDTKSYAFSTVTGGLVNIVVSILLVNKLNILGVAIGTLVSYIFIWSIRYFRSKRYINLNIRFIFSFTMYTLLFIEAFLGMQGFNVFICLLQILILLVLIKMNWVQIKELYGYVYNLLSKKGGRVDGKISN